MSAVASQPTDIYSHERASLREHLEQLNGRTTWREPHGSPGTRSDTVPHEHTLAAALAFARDTSTANDDVGPDILECLIYRRPVHVDRIVTAMVRAVTDMSGILAKADQGAVRQLCQAMLRECVTGVEAERPNGMRQKEWIKGSTLASMLIWASAGQTIKRAAERLG